MRRYVGRRARARSVRGLGDDARAGARERPRRDGRRHRGVQLPADAGEDRSDTTCSRSSTTSATRWRVSRRAMGGPGVLPATCGVVRALGRSSDLLALPALAASYEHADVLRDRARARGTLGAADDPLRPRLPARARSATLLVPQAPARVPAGRAGGALPAPLHARHARAAQGVRARARRRTRRRSSTATRARLELGGPFDARRHLAAVPGADRLPRAAPLRVRAARARRPARAWSSVPQRRARAARAIAAYVGRDRRGARARGGRAAAGRAAARSSSTTAATSTRRSSSAPACALDGRHRRHVNRRTGRRAGEYFEDVLVARRG